jgi:hypothetical protein
MQKASLVQYFISHRFGSHARRIPVLCFSTLAALLAPLIAGPQQPGLAGMWHGDGFSTPSHPDAGVQQQATPSLNGRWKIVSGSGKYKGVFVLQQNGSRLTGNVMDTNIGSAGTLEGSVEGRKVRLTRRWAGGSQTYDLTLDAAFDRMSGTFDGTRDMSVANDAQLEREGPGPVSPPLNLNGTWSNSLLHIWHEGDQVLITASWKRDNGVWVIFRAEGKLAGRVMNLPVRYSAMTNAVGGELRGVFTVSDDGNGISAHYTLDGHSYDDRVYYRDR